jgi:hypothetical protein
VPAAKIAAAKWPSLPKRGATRRSKAQAAIAAQRMSVPAIDSVAPIGANSSE